LANNNTQPDFCDRFAKIHLTLYGKHFRHRLILNTLTKSRRQSESKLNRRSTH